MGIEDEIKEMNTLNDIQSEEPTPAQEETKEAEVIDESPSMVEEEKEEIAEEPTEPEPQLVDHLAELKAELQALKDELKHLKEPKSAEPEPEPEPAVEAYNFFEGTDEDPYDIISDKEKLNTLLNKVYQLGVATARVQTSEAVFRKLPEVIKNNVETYLALAEASKRFYNDNPDLKPYAKQVAEIYESIAPNNTDRTVEDLFTILAHEARRRLKLQKKAARPEIPPGSKGKAPIGKPQLSGIMAEIEAMNALED